MSNIEPRDFIKKWVEAYRFNKGTRWIASELEVNPNYVSQLAVTYRKKGINLPKLRNFAPLDPNDVSELNLLISEQLNR